MTLELSLHQRISGFFCHGAVRVVAVAVAANIGFGSAIAGSALQAYSYLLLGNHHGLLYGAREPFFYGSYFLCSNACLLFDDNVQYNKQGIVCTETD